MQGNLWTVAILVVVVGVAAVAIPATLSEQTETRSVTNETATLQQNETTFLDHKQNMSVIYQNETVRDGTTLLDRGEDYLIDYDEAAIYANSTQFNGTQVEINYSYGAIENDRTNRIATLITPFNAVLGLLAILALFGAVFGLMGWW